MTDTPSTSPTDTPTPELANRAPDSNGKVHTERRPRGRRHSPQDARPAPRSREVHPVLQQLFALYPKMFGPQFLPLKLGVYQELLALHPDAFKPEDLKVALGLHARSMRYLESVAAGHPRHDLQGVPVEPVAPEHVHHAMLEVFKRHQGRTQEDLRPHLRVRMMHAIEASGLSHEDYALRVRTQDETTNALLGDALAALKLEAAKREALARTFEASGQTAAQFADMYGMDPVEVTRVLERVRLDQEKRQNAASVAQTAEAPADASSDAA